MDPIVIEPTHKTPEVKTDWERGRFFIRGKSIPEDSRDFFRPLKDWLTTYLESKPESLSAEIDLEYFNTSTSIVLLDIFKKISQHRERMNVQIIWYYEKEDLDMEEVGQDYQSMLGDIIELRIKDRTAASQ